MLLHSLGEEDSHSCVSGFSAPTLGEELPVLQGRVLGRVTTGVQAAATQTGGMGPGSGLLSIAIKNSALLRYLQG